MATRVLSLCKFNADHTEMSYQFRGYNEIETAKVLDVEFYHTGDVKSAVLDRLIHKSNAESEFSEYNGTEHVRQITLFGSVVSELSFSCPF
ncbi:hypothetical protein OCF84_21785 (plasmid) [Shewanella xiamenensis]|uniref:Uncharacterized protein n=1 Tax=Shewanella xiamenensis TaxID=332186 RepID=A0ABT6UDE8_9GAMM|nr:hypothetical protein [Shewanella xiamenensis]MDI5832489.1 hypothetical protein [Shewanella xiamenensis]WHF57892.1 hypothetical protein OCF84_21785 [Shewanella xiamenensis]